MVEVNFYDGKIHDWYGHTQPVPDGTLIRVWTGYDVDDWEGKVWPAETWSWNIEGNLSDIKRFQVVK